MTAPSEFNCDRTDNPVCPHCGHEYPFEPEPNFKETCDSCGGLYLVSKHRSVTYSTTPTTELDEKLKVARRQLDELEGLIRELEDAGRGSDKHLLRHKERIANLRRAFDDVVAQLTAEETEAAR